MIVIQEFIIFPGITALHLIALCWFFRDINRKIRWMFVYYFLELSIQRIYSDLDF